MTERMDVAEYRRLMGIAKPGDSAPPKKKRAPESVKKDLGVLLCMFLGELGELPPWEREWKFDDERQWRFDLAFPTVHFAVEIEGVTREGGRHQRMDGFLKDLEKYEAAMLQGWTIYRCSTAMVRSGHAAQVIARMLQR